MISGGDERGRQRQTWAGMRVSRRRRVRKVKTWAGYNINLYTYALLRSRVKTITPLD